jgi:hypothetical protein
LPVILSHPAKKFFKRLANLLMSDLLAPYIPGKGVIRLFGRNQNPQTSTAAANNRATAASVCTGNGELSDMRHLKLFSLLSVPSLALLVSGCGGSNGGGHTTQTITFDNPGTQTVGAPLTLSATANSGLTVSFTSATASDCTVSGASVTFGAAGTCTIDASVAGNSTYAAASQVAQSFTVNPAIGPTTTVYIAGYAVTSISAGNADDTLAEEWQLASGSPTATATTLSMPSGMTSSQANAIAVSGSDVYVGGIASNSTSQTAVYWLNNGAATTLPSVMASSQANAIAVSGSNVYVAGYGENSAGNGGTAVLWVNGTATTLSPPSGMAYSDAKAIAVSGSNVYVAGFAWNNNSDESAVLWVNGAATLLPMPSGLTGEYYAYGITVSGGKVYVSGHADSSANLDTAISWVNNGAATTLPIPPNDTAGNYDAVGITVSGSDVYVAGSGTNGATGDTNAAYWINGTPTTLPMPSDININATSYAVGIAVSGSDVYAVGTLLDSMAGVDETAAYWVNGGEATLLPMPSGTSESYASAIAVATQ